MATISVSHAYLDCSFIATALCNANIPCNVIATASVVDKDDGPCALERGCRIHLKARHIDAAWKTIRGRTRVHCAHLKTGTYDGCILDFVSKD